MGFCMRLSSSARITGNPGITANQYPADKCCRSDNFRIGDNPLMTKEEGSVQLADAAWTLRGACRVGFSVCMVRQPES
jgi:hypothetical protein